MIANYPTTVFELGSCHCQKLICSLSLSLIVDRLADTIHKLKNVYLLLFLLLIVICKRKSVFIYRSHALNKLEIYEMYFKLNYRALLWRPRMSVDCTFGVCELQTPQSSRDWQFAFALWEWIKLHTLVFFLAWQLISCLVIFSAVFQILMSVCVCGLM